MTHPHPELGPPPPLAPHALRVVPLGGCGEIGRNMTVFEYAGRLLVVDCGVLFPSEEQPGVDLILPDFSWLHGRFDAIDAVVLTHGHEDHIGAVPYLLREAPDALLVGTKLTLAFLDGKLQEKRIDARRQVVREGERARFGPFECEFLAASHSIPDALALSIRTAAGLVLHTGDFKLDQLPLDARLTDIGGFARLGAEGIDLLLSDSTNAEVPGFVTSEREVGDALRQVFAHAERRIIVACFASHVHRVQQVLDTAKSHGRKVAFVGRSMLRNMGTARDLGYLHVPADLVVDLDDMDELPPDEVVLISTGSQGEPLSALSRMANRDHRVRIESGDTVILASSLVPGNESAVYRVINGLARWGAVVVHKDLAQVHVSGHAPAGELLYVLNVTRPSNFMPVHGEWRHMRAHAQLAASIGVPPDRIVLAEDGVVVDLADGRACVAGIVPAGNVFVHGLGVGDIRDEVIKDRRILRDEGFVSVVVVVDVVSGKVSAGPQIAARGFTDDQTAFDPLRPLIEDALAEAGREGVTDIHQLQQLVRRTVGRWVNETYRRRPMIVPVVIEV